MSSFVVGSHAGKDMIVTLPVPPDWSTLHDEKGRTIEVYMAGTNYKVTFVYDLSVNGHVWLKDSVKVTGPRYGCRVKASTALEMLAVLRAPFNR